MYFTHTGLLCSVCPLPSNWLEWNNIETLAVFLKFLSFSLPLSSLLSFTLSHQKRPLLNRKTTILLRTKMILQQHQNINNNMNSKQIALKIFTGLSSNIINTVWCDSHIYPFHHSIHDCRLASSSTSSTESSPSRLVIVGGGGGGSSSSRSHIDAYDDPYVNANASTSGLSTQLSATAVAAAVTGSATTVTPPPPLLHGDVLPSTSSLTTSPLQPIRHSVRDLLEPDKTKRVKLDRQFDIDDTCSNDAFIFNASLKESPLKNNPKTATVPSNASK